MSHDKVADGTGTLSDEALCPRYREDGDVDAFARLSDRYGDAIVRFLKRLLRDPEAAEDLACHSFSRLHEARASFDPSRSRHT